MKLSSQEGRIDHIGLQGQRLAALERKVLFSCAKVVKNQCHDFAQQKLDLGVCINRLAEDHPVESWMISFHIVSPFLMLADCGFALLHMMDVSGCVPVFLYNFRNGSVHLSWQCLHGNCQTFPVFFQKL